MLCAKNIKICVCLPKLARFYWVAVYRVIKVIVVIIPLQRHKEHAESNSACLTYSLGLKYSIVFTLVSSPIIADMFLILLTILRVGSLRSVAMYVWRIISNCQLTFRFDFNCAIKSTLYKHWRFLFICYSCSLLGSCVFTARHYA